MALQIKMIARDKFTDIIVTVGKKSYNLHKIILCQLPYFEALLCGNFDEGKQSNIILKDFDNKTFEEMINALYSSISSASIIFNESSTIETLKMASFFGLEEAIDSYMKKTKKNYYIHVDNYAYNRLSQASIKKQSIKDYDLQELENYLKMREDKREKYFMTTQLIHQEISFFSQFNNLSNYPLVNLYFHSLHYMDDDCHYVKENLNIIYRSLYDYEDDMTNSEILEAFSS